MDKCKNCGETVAMAGVVPVHAATRNTYCYDDDGPENPDDYATYNVTEAEL